MTRNWQSLDDPTKVQFYVLILVNHVENMFWKVLKRWIRCSLKSLLVFFIMWQSRRPMPRKALFMLDQIQMETIFIKLLLIKKMGQLQWRPSPMLWMLWGYCDELSSLVNTQSPEYTIPTPRTSKRIFLQHVLCIWC